MHLEYYKEREKELKILSTNRSISKNVLHVSYEAMLQGMDELVNNKILPFLGSRTDSSMHSFTHLFSTLYLLFYIYYLPVTVSPNILKSTMVCHNFGNTNSRACNLSLFLALFEKIQQRLNFCKAWLTLSMHISLHYCIVFSFPANLLTISFIKTKYTALLELLCICTNRLSHTQQLIL